MGEDIIPTYHINICGIKYMCIYVYVHIDLCVEGVLGILATVYVCKKLCLIRGGHRWNSTISGCIGVPYGM